MIDSGPIFNRKGALLFKSLLAGVFLSLATAAGALADIQISPLRQVLSPEAGEAYFEVSNPSRRLLHGAVSWVDMTATPTGYAPASIDERAALSAAPYLTVSPAQFRLKPGGRVRIAIRLKEGARIPKGERRSHLLIETEASRTPIRKAGNSGLQVDIGLGVSAPVLLRNGGSAKAKIDDAKLLRDDEGLLLLETSIKPKGEISTFGRVTVSFSPADDPQAAHLLGERRNVAGFLDAPRRTVETPLGFVSLGAGELTIRYEGEAEFEGRVFDSRTYEIAPPE